MPYLTFTMHAEGFMNKLWEYNASDKQHEIVVEMPEHGDQLVLHRKQEVFTPPIPMLLESNVCRGEVYERVVYSIAFASSEDYWLEVAVHTMDFEVDEQKHRPVRSFIFYKGDLVRIDFSLPIMDQYVYQQKYMQQLEALLLGHDHEA